MIGKLPNRIPGSPGWQLIQWIADPLAFQERAFIKYGDLFTINLSGLGEVVILANPQAIQEIFSRDARSFDVGRANLIAAPIVGENSLMLMDGDRHRRERKLLMPPFHGERLSACAGQIYQITDSVASKWQEAQQFTVRTVMQDITLEVIIQVIFGLRAGERYRQIKPLLADMLNMTDSPLRSSILFLRFLQKDWGSWSPWGRMQRRREKIYRLLQAEIEDRRKQNEIQGEDILSLMMAARDEDAQPMRDEELKDELITLLFAGHETTATLLSWSLYQIHRHAEVLARLAAELAPLGDEPDLMAIIKLPYLNAVYQETLRMYPVIPILFPRIAREPIAIMGYNYAAETIFAPSIYLVHYREDLYPEAQKFKPERFLARQYSPSEYLPFGGGSRRCLGYALAELEIKLVLAHIVSNYHLKLADNKPIKIQRRGFTLAPQGGVGMLMMGRREKQSDSKNFATLV
jgi:unspecific monooxygenase